MNDALPHDGQCEQLARRRGERTDWPEWKPCDCDERRLAHSESLPESPVDLPWLAPPKGPR